MKLMELPRTALMDLQPQRSYQIAWFVYGCIEREYVLNVSACADWWMRAIGISAAQLKAPWQSTGNTVPPVTPQVVVHDTDRAEATRQRSPSQVGPRP